MRKPNLYQKSIGLKIGSNGATDLTGLRFGRLFVSKRLGSKGEHSLFECICDCGRVIQVIAPYLKRQTDQEKSCGCAPKSPPGSFKDLTGKHFGRLTVISRVPNYVKSSGDQISKWECICDCGNIVLVIADSLQQKGVRSCGCLFEDYIHRLGKGAGAKRHAFRVIKAIAKRRGISFDLTFDEFVSICELPCHYCGIISSQIQSGFKRNGSIVHHYGSWKHNGIDRHRNDEPYSNGNCFPCCTFCNVAKSTMSERDFLFHIKRIFAKRQGLPAQDIIKFPQSRMGEGFAESSPFVDLTGQKFGKLTVLKRSCSIIGHSVFECQCDCGKRIELFGYQIKHANVRSCGCSGLTPKIPNTPIEKAQHYWFNHVTRNSAKRRGLVFKLTLERFVQISEQPCYYCGIQPYKFSAIDTKGNGWTHGGLDRKNNAQGYSIENVVPCCEVCNVAKRSLSEEEFYSNVERVMSYQKMQTKDSSASLVPSSLLTPSLFTV